MHMKRSRREFVRDAALIGAGLWLADQPWAKSQSPNERIHFACIGVGGKGDSDTADAARLGNVVAICDVDDNMLAEAVKKYPQARVYNDFRKMLEEMNKSIDAVTVSTPDHTHAPAAAMAMHMGKHCFCQKPLTHSLYEARKLGELARKMKVATQMGNQGTASSDLRRAAALIRAGAVGVVQEVHVWTDRAKGWWPQGIARPPEAPIPSNLHWDLWLGPAPARPYAEGYHPFAWRGWWDFGTGALGDMGCHVINMPFMALDLRNPISVVAETSGHNRESYPEWSIVHYEFAPTKERPGLKMTWYDGGKLPSPDLIDGQQPASNGVIVVGDKGRLYTPDAHSAGPQLLGGAEMKEVTIVESPGHFEEFVCAIKTGQPAMSNFPDYASPLTETVLLGNLAVWAEGKKIEWDARRLRAKNAPEVEPIIRTKYRAGYSL